MTNWVHLLDREFQRICFTSITESAEANLVDEILLEESQLFNEVPRVIMSNPNTINTSSKVFILDINEVASCERITDFRYFEVDEFRIVSDPHLPIVEVHQNFFRRERRVEIRGAIGESFDRISNREIGADAVHKRWLADGF